MERIILFKKYTTEKNLNFSAKKLRQKESDGALLLLAELSPYFNGIAAGRPSSDISKNEMVATSQKKPSFLS